MGAGKLLEHGFEAWKAARARDEVVEVLADGVKVGDDLVEATLKSGDEIAGRTIVQIKNGTNGKTAIIGRRMDGHVNVVAAELSSQGRQVDVFNKTYQAGKTFEIDGISHSWKSLSDDFNDLSKYARNEKGWILDSDLPNTLMFKANKQWADNLLDRGFEILDMGYPEGLTSESIFYNMELEKIF